MTYNEILQRVIDDGIAACKESYAGYEDKRLGSIAGFTECMDRSPEELKKIYSDATVDMNRAFNDGAPNYWYWRCRQAEIEWVINVMSCVLQCQGKEGFGMMTARGYMKAEEVLRGAPK